jgi:hypothetical protein
MINEIGNPFEGAMTMKRRMLQFIIVGALGTCTAMAQTGKISGTVMDRETREPLVGATVQIVGTTYGAATDVDGRYDILNIPPGEYSVRATFVGYQEVTVTNIRITQGLTRDLNFQLAATAVEVEPVTIIGERPLIEKSATNVTRILTSTDIARLPVRGAQGAIAIQPGVVLQNQRVYIRGSRASEVGYQLEGANTRNIVGGNIGPADENAGNLVTVIPEAIEEAVLQAGGYTAEFGGANAGIVSQNLRTGRERYHVMAQVETDNPPGVDPGERFLGTYSYGYTDAVITASGPTMTDKVRFFIAGQNRFMRDYTPTFWEGADFGTMYDTGVRGGHAGDSANVRWLPGNIPGRSSNRYSLNGTILYDAKPLLIKGSATHSWQRTRANGLSDEAAVPSVVPLRQLFAMDRLPQVDQSNLLLNLRGTYFIRPTLFGEVTLSFLDDRSKQYDPNFDDSNILLYGDSLEAAKRGWTYRSYSDVPRPYDFFGFPFNRPGTPLTGFAKNQSGYLSGGASVTSQTGRHELKAGLSYEHWTVRRYAGIAAGELAPLLTAVRAEPDAARDEAALARIIRRETFLDNFGFDEFGRKLDSGPDGPKHPKFFGAYLQDKIEFSDIIINAGLRWDVMDLNTWDLKNPNDPGFEANDFLINEDSLSATPAFSYLQPRLGLSFPVSDRTVFHLQYGQFVQAPPLYTAYRGRAAAALIFVGQFYITNPVAYNIQPTRTTQYEIGFTQQFSDFASFDVTGFYKDIKGQPQYDIFLVNRSISPVANYPIYTNADFATTKGLELSMTVRRIQRIQAQFNYTLSDARGTNSFPSSAAAGLNVAGTRPTAVSPLTYDQTHRGSVNLDYRFGAEEGGPILQQLGVNLLFTFNSGHRFTLATGSGGQQGPETGALLNDADARTRQPLQPINTSVTPWVFNLDARIDKSFPLAGVQFTVYGYVQNVFNTKNVINVYSRTGNAFDDAFLNRPDLSERIISGLGPTYVDMYRAINLENRQHQWQLNGIDLFSTPRQIRFGVHVEI